MNARLYTLPPFSQRPRFWRPLFEGGAEANGRFDKTSAFSTPSFDSGLGDSHFFIGSESLLHNQSQSSETDQFSASLLRQGTSSIDYALPHRNAFNSQSNVFYVVSGWQSADVYKDIDKTSEAGLPTAGNLEGTNVHRTPIWYSKAGASYDGFGVVITYIQSDDKIIPRVAAVKSLLSGRPLPEATFYNEFDASINYTYSFGRIIDATIGYNAFLPLNHDFFGTNYSGETFVTIALQRYHYYVRTSPSANLIANLSNYEESLSKCDWTPSGFLFYTTGRLMLTWILTLHLVSTMI